MNYTMEYVAQVKAWIFPSPNAMEIFVLISREAELSPSEHISLYNGIYGRL